MRDLIDVGGSRIERDIGDDRGRTPHFVVDREEWEDNVPDGVLYWPTPGGWWSACAFRTLDDAVRFVDKLAEKGLRGGA